MPKLEIEQTKDAQTTEIALRRWMYRGQKRNWIAKILNRMGPAVVSTGGGEQLGAAPRAQPQLGRSQASLTPVRRESMRLKVFIVMLVITGLGLVIYGAMSLLSPQALMDSFAQYVYVFPAVATHAIGYQSALYRLLGYFNILLGATALALLLRWRKAPAAWLLQASFALTVLAYLGPVVFDNTVGHVGPLEIVEVVLMATVLVTGALARLGRRP